MGRARGREVGGGRVREGGREGGCTGEGTEGGRRSESGEVEESLHLYAYTYV